MKTLFTYLAAGAMAVAALFPGAALRADQQAPIPVVVQPTVAQYKVIDISQIGVAPTGSPAATLQAILNSQAAQGWRLVTISGSIIILAR